MNKRLSSGFAIVGLSCCATASLSQSAPPAGTAFDAYRGDRASGWLGRAAPGIDDVVQSAFLKLAIHPDLHAIATLAPISSRLPATSRSKGQRSNIRRYSLQNELSTQASTAPPLCASSVTILVDRERLAHIEAVLRRTPKLRRRIFLLFRVEGMSVRDVSAPFGLSEAAVYNHVARASKDCVAMLGTSDRRASI